MDQRERWQALQSHLSTARACVDKGDRTKALEAIDAALAIDPDFLAAHSLRDCILAPPLAGAETAPAPSGQTVSAPGDSAAPTSPAESRPAVSTDGYARFEARARRRRVDRRIDAARAALERRRLKDAAVALDEIIELDPNLPELLELTTSFDELRRANAGTDRGRGPWIAAAASFAVVLFGASWLQETQPLASIQTSGVAMPVEPPTTAPFVDTNIVEVSVAPPAAPVGTSGANAAIRDAEFAAGAPQAGHDEPRAVTAVTRTDPRNATSDSRVTTAEPRFTNPNVERIPVVEPAGPSPLDLLAAPATVAPPTPSIMSAMAPPAPAPIAVPVSAPVLPRSIDPSDEVALVKQTLQRYRNAYDGLDAQSAQQVYPAVNQAALARAFDGLESQTLTFDACDVQLRGEAATATCRGSARYVPKIGSREPRVEPRTWNFTLRKAGNDWRIDSARAER